MMNNSKDSRPVKNELIHKLYKPKHCGLWVRKKPKWEKHRASIIFPGEKSVMGIGKEIKPGLSVYKNFSYIIVNYFFSSYKIL